MGKPTKNASLQFGGLAPPPWLASWTDSVRGGAHQPNQYLLNLVQCHSSFLSLKVHEARFLKKRSTQRRRQKHFPFLMCGASLNRRAGGWGGGGVKWWSFCSDLNNNFIFQIREPMAELSYKLDSTRVLLQLMGLTRFSSFPSSYFLLLLSFSSFSFSSSSVSSSSSFSPTPSRCHNSSSFTVFCSVNLNYSNLISRVTSADTVPPSSLASPSSRWLLFFSTLTVSFLCDVSLWPPLLS